MMENIRTFVPASPTRPAPVQSPRVGTQQGHDGCSGAMWIACHFFVPSGKKLTIFCFLFSPAHTPANHSPHNIAIFPNAQYNYINGPGSQPSFHSCADDSTQKNRSALYGRSGRQMPPKDQSVYLFSSISSER